MQLITGRTGVQHVKAIDDAEIIRTLLGDGDYVLSTGQKMNAQMNGTNEIDIYHGTAIMQGRQVKIRSSEGYNAVSLDNGVTGYKRWDVVVIEYTKEDDIEDATLKVIKGANSTGYVEPTVPYINGSIDNGETHQMKLWGVRFDGINFDSLIDYRTVLDTSPVNVLLSSMTAIEEQIEARIASVENMAKTVPMFRVDGTDMTTVSNALTFEKPTGYTYANTDGFMLWLNGLRILDDDYEVSSSGSNLVVTLPNIDDEAYYDEIILDIWKMED